MNRPVVRYGIALLILALIVWRTHPADLWRQVQSADLQPVLIALALAVLGVVGVIARSALLIRRLGYHLPMTIVATTTLVGYVAGAVTPAASGEVLRAAMLRTHAGVPMERGIALVVYERAVSLYLLAVSTGVALAVTSLDAGLAVAAAVAGGLLVLAPWAIAVTVLPRLPDGSGIQGTGLWPGLRRYVLATAHHLRFLLADVGLLVGWSAITLGVFAVSAYQVHLLADSVAASINFGESWVAFGGSQLIGYLSLLPFGLGVADGSLAAILDGYGLTFDQATAVVVLVRGVLTLTPTVIGMLCYVYLNHATTKDVPQEETA